MTMLSRILGLVRDVLLARFIGAGGDADAFYVAFKIPNFLRRLFAEGAFAQAFVPVLSEYRANGSKEAVRYFIDRIAGCLGITLIGVCGLAVIAAPAVTAVFGMGFLFEEGHEKFVLTTELIRVTFPYLFLISLTGFAGSILNSYDRFAVPALTPVILNISLIVAAALVSPHLDRPVFALAWGVIVAGILQLAFQLPFLARLGLLPRPKVDWSDPAVKKVLILMAPAMFGVSVSQINLLVDTILASFLIDGSISWLYYSDRLIELPLGIFGVGIATVILPNLSRQFSQGAEKFSATLDWAMRMVLLVAVPSSIALISIAQPILFTLFQYEEMTANDMVMSSYSLSAYAIGLVAFMLIKVLASGYFARQDMRTPVRIGIIAMVSNMGLNFLFVLPLMHYGQIGHVGLALATSCSAFLNAGLLLTGLIKTNVYRPESGWLMFCARLLFSSILMITVVLCARSFMSPFVALAWSGRSINLSILVVIGISAYIVGLTLSGLRIKHLRIDA